MKRNIQLFIILLLAILFLSACDDIGLLPSTPNIPVSEGGTTRLTPEEIELIREWGFGGDYVVRWPDGCVDVYDATDYSEMQKVLDQWNSVIGGRVKFCLSKNENSPVKIEIDESIDEEGLCSWADYDWDCEKYFFTEYLLKINPKCKGFLENVYQLYLYNFNGVAGFNAWKDIEITPFEHWSKFYEIPPIIKKMIRALHRVSPGYYLNQQQEEQQEEEQEIEFEEEGEQYECEYCENNYFEGLNNINYDNKNTCVVIKIKPKNNKELPNKIEIILKGIQWIIDEKKPQYPYWDNNIKTIATYSTSGGINYNGYEISKEEDRIYIRLSKDYSYAFKAVPWKNVELYVYTYINNSRQLLGHYSFKDGGGIMPWVKSAFGQCVWWACKRKWDTDGNIPPFYPPLGEQKTIEITGNYEPKFKDVLIYYEDTTNPGQLGHYAFVEEVTEKSDGTYDIKISQYNFPCKSNDNKEQTYSEKIIKSWKKGKGILYYIGNDGKTRYFHSYFR